MIYDMHMKAENVAGMLLEACKKHMLLLLLENLKSCDSAVQIATLLISFMETSLSAVSSLVDINLEDT